MKKRDNNTYTILSFLEHSFGQLKKKILRDDNPPTNLVLNAEKILPDGQNETAYNFFETLPLDLILAIQNYLDSDSAFNFALCLIGSKPKVLPHEAFIKFKTALITNWSLLPKPFIAAGKQSSFYFSPKKGLQTWGVSRNYSNLLSNEKKVTAVAENKNYTLYLMDDGTVYEGIAIIKKEPHQASITYQVRLVEELKSRIVAIAAGVSHALALTADGKVYGRGSNQLGQLGLGRKVTFAEKFTLLAELNEQRIKLIAAGDKHSLFAIEKSVYACGDNREGQLGLNHKDKQFEPQLVKVFAEEVAAIAAGTAHSLIATTKTLYSAGLNGVGQLGRENLEEWQLAVVNQFEGKQIKALAAGPTHSLVLTSTGEVYGFGSNIHKQLGEGDIHKCSPKQISELKGKKVAAIAAGSHSLFLTYQCRLWALGNNHHNQLGFKTAADNTLSLRRSGDSSITQSDQVFHQLR